ncbi:MAG: SDR family oxidoreductase [Candidatus Heimdallarchaeota archaeon]
MDLELEGKVALVAASSKGLGRAVALGLAREGAKLTVCSRNEDLLAQATQEIEILGREVLAVPTDLTKYEEVRQLVGKTIDRYGRIDILVTNCGGPPSGTFLDFSIEDWQNAINLSLMSTIYLCKEVIPIMVKQGSGQIIMNTSVTVKQPNTNLILSNVPRAGVTALAKTLSNEFGKFNIRVNVVCPGYTRTERIVNLAETLSKKRGVPTEEILKDWEQQNALGRIGEPEEYANVVVFLASGRASYLTGVTLQIDGGLVQGLL